jgi:putative intracellular protease/amidase
MPNLPQRVLLVLTSQDHLGDHGGPTGYYLPEAAHPWKVFTEAGYQVDFVSVAGGKPPMIGHDPADEVQNAFLADATMQQKLQTTPTPAEVKAGDFAAVLYVGGHGTMWDFPDETGLSDLAREIYETGGVVAAVCHGPAGLVNIKLSNGDYLVDGKEFAGFTNDEEDAVGMTSVVPFLLQDKLEERGGKHVKKPNFEPCVVVSERLVTGQNPASAKGVAEAALELLEG